MSVCVVQILDTQGWMSVCVVQSCLWGADLYKVYIVHFVQICTSQTRLSTHDIFNSAILSFCLLVMAAYEYSMKWTYQRTMLAEVTVLSWMTPAHWLLWASHSHLTMCLYKKVQLPSKIKVVTLHYIKISKFIVWFIWIQSLNLVSQMLVIFAVLQLNKSNIIDR